MSKSHVPRPSDEMKLRHKYCSHHQPPFVISYQPDHGKADASPPTTWTNIWQRLGPQIDMKTLRLLTLLPLLINPLQPQYGFPNPHASFWGACSVADIQPAQNIMLGRLLVRWFGSDSILVERQNCHILKRSWRSLQPAMPDYHFNGRCIMWGKSENLKAVFIWTGYGCPCDQWLSQFDPATWRNQSFQHLPWTCMAWSKTPNSFKNPILSASSTITFSLNPVSPLSRLPNNSSSYPSLLC